MHPKNISVVKPVPLPTEIAELINKSSYKNTDSFPETKTGVKRKNRMDTLQSALNRPNKFFFILPPHYFTNIMKIKAR